MANLMADVATVSMNLAAIEARVAAACSRTAREPQSVRICAATKYVDADGMDVLREVGVQVAAENRLQDMIAKQERFRDDFEWHFIGRIQSRKIAAIAERVDVIHSLATESARDRLAAFQGSLPRVLVQVNIADEESKEGVSPQALAEFVAACPFKVSGLMTMPPLADDPEDARPYFQKLAKLAAELDLTELSMGTTQDFEVAVEEGATLIRVGSALFAPPN